MGFTPLSPEALFRYVSPPSLLLSYLAFPPHIGFWTFLCSFLLYFISFSLLRSISCIHLARGVFFYRHRVEFQVHRSFFPFPLSMHMNSACVFFRSFMVFFSPPTHCLTLRATFPFFCLTVHYADQAVRVFAILTASFPSTPPFPTVDSSADQPDLLRTSLRTLGLPPESIVYILSSC